MNQLKQINKKTLIISAAALVVFIIAVGLFLSKDYLWPKPAQPVVGEPVDVVLEFYEPWLLAAQSTTTDPYKEGYAKSLLLSPELRNKVAKGKGRVDTEVDPVLCNTFAPLQLSTRLVSQLEGQAQVLVLSRDTVQTGQAVVDLIQEGEGWYINDITCSPGEFGPEREFSFDTEGFLLKSVVAPLNPAYWHLVFEQRGVAGYAAPLFFGPDSTCISTDKKETVCNPSTFVEPSRAHVKGQMTELGVEVKRVELLKD